ncbi:MAG: hypothetical protein GY844_18630 [Bradyrhizobium sp.]|uniref:hypothetical protein n=1 Tax=Bacteria TaxID=2 RepID=UPI000A6F97E5|nr:MULTISPECIES: hypothetical protein [Bacteria]MCP4618438.1 hypothetical protein [Bradyrhizobium sp.]
MPPDHFHKPMPLALRLRLRLLTGLELLLLPHRRRSRTAASLLAWIDAEHVRIHDAVHRDDGGRA